MQQEERIGSVRNESFVVQQENPMRKRMRAMRSTEATASKMLKWSAKKRRERRREERRAEGRAKKK